MTRKDYNLIAEAFRIEYEEVAPVPETLEYREGMRIMVVGLSFKLAAANPRFDRLRFMRASGIDVNTSEYERESQ